MRPPYLYSGIPYIGEISLNWGSSPVIIGDVLSPRTGYSNRSGAALTGDPLHNLTEIHTT